MNVQLKISLADDPRRRMLRFFSPLPKKAKQVPPSGLSPMVSARFPEPKPQERRRVVLAPVVSKKKKDKRGGANRGQGRKKGSLGQKRKREAGERRGNTTTQVSKHTESKKSDH